MNFILLNIALFIVLTADAGAVQPKAIELTKDNPPTLVGTDSKDYLIYGLRLGMSRKEAEKILAESKVLRGVQDEYNPTRIYVYYRDAGRRVTDSVLYLIWKPGRSRLSEITVYKGFKDSLAENFRRLLTKEALDQSSEFMKSYVGLPDRAIVTLEIKSIGTKITAYCYDGIGLQVLRLHDPDSEGVYFALVEKGEVTSPK